MRTRTRRVLLILSGVCIPVLLGLFLYCLLKPEEERISPAQEREARHHNNLGVALIDNAACDSKFYREAEKEFEAALQIFPTYLTARINLGICYFLHSTFGKDHNQYDFNTVIRHLQTVLDSDPRNVRAHYALGCILMQRMDRKRAESHFRIVLEEDPEDFYSMANLGVCLYQEKRPAEAIPIFRKALARAPFNTKVLYTLTIALRDGGHDEERKDLYERFETIRKSLDLNHNFLCFQHVGDVCKFYPDKYLLPIADSNGARDSEGNPPIYFDITRESGLPSKLVSPSNAELERAIQGEPLPREWFLSQENRRGLIAALCSGCGISDLDGDMKLDLLCVSAAGGISLYLQKADGKFEDSTERWGLAATQAAGSTCFFGDIDDDGRPDLFIAGFGWAHLYRNTGSRFEDVTESSGISRSIDESTWPTGAAFSDIDHDGDLDLYVTCLVDPAKVPEKPAPRFPNDFEGQPNLLFRNNRDGTFTEIAATAHAGERPGKARGAVFSDLNRDRVVDLVTFDIKGTLRTFLNRRDGTFAPAPEAAWDLPPISPPGESRALGDLDGDGAPELLLNLEQAWAVY